MSRLGCVAACCAFLLFNACRDESTPLEPAAPSHLRQLSSASDYEVIDLGTLGGMNGSYAVDINDRGQVVGWSHSPSDWGRAVLWENGVMSVLPALSEGAAGPSAINNAGLIVGESESPSLRAALVTWKNGVIRHLCCDLQHSRIDALNRRGDILLSFFYMEREAEAAVWRDGVLHRLGHLASSPTYAWAMNDRGAVVGASTALIDAEVFHPFLWERGVMRDLGVLGRSDANGEALDINASRTVVGWSQDSTGLTRPFLWRHGKMRELDAAPGLPASAIAINDRGQVAGTYTLPPAGPGRPGDIRSFLWDRGVTQDLGTLPSGGTTQAVAINTHGDIIGWSGSPRRAFVWRNGRLHDLGVGPDGGAVSQAVAINARGDVVGWSSENTLGWPPRALLWRRRGARTVAGP